MLYDIHFQRRWFIRWMVVYRRQQAIMVDRWCFQQTPKALNILSLVAQNMMLFYLRDIELK